MCAWERVWVHVREWVWGVVCESVKVCVCVRVSGQVCGIVCVSVSGSGYVRSNLFNLA